jgi:hypothetical protein
MSSGPKIPDNLRNWITQQAQLHSKWTVSKIQSEMASWIRVNHPSYAVPQYDAVQKAARKARNVKSPLEELWSLGIGESFGISADATADLLAIWRRSIIGGTTFTIRQAIWAARIRGAVQVLPPKNRVEEIYGWAAAYAANHRVAEVLGKPIDTSFLDSNLAFMNEDGLFDWDQWWLATNLGAFPKSGGDSDLSTLIQELGLVRAKEIGLRPREVDSDEVQFLRKMIRSSSTEHLADTSSDDSWEDRTILLLRNIFSTTMWRKGSAEDRNELLRRAADPSEAFDKFLEELGI